MQKEAAALLALHLLPVISMPMVRPISSWELVVLLTPAVLTSSTTIAVSQLPPSLQISLLLVKQQIIILALPLPLVTSMPMARPTLPSEQMATLPTPAVPISSTMTAVSRRPPRLPTSSLLVRQPIIILALFLPLVTSMPMVRLISPSEHLGILLRLAGPISSTTVPLLPKVRAVLMSSSPAKRVVILESPSPLATSTPMVRLI